MENLVSLIYRAFVFFREHGSLADCDRTHDGDITLFLCAGVALAVIKTDSGLVTGWNNVDTIKKAREFAWQLATKVGRTTPQLAVRA